MEFFNSMYEGCDKSSSDWHIKTLSHVEYQALHDGDVLHILRMQHIVITGGPVWGAKFNGKALQRLGTTMWPIVIQGAP